MAWPFLPVNPACPAIVTKPAAEIIYYGDDLFCTNVVCGDSIKAALIKIEAKICTFSEGNITKWVELDDTPEEYTGHEGESVSVNSTATALIFTPSTFVYIQGLPLSSWNIIHTLNKFPSVTIVDTSGNVVIGEVLFVSDSNVIVSFSASFGGKAFLN